MASSSMLGTTLYAWGRLNNVSSTDSCKLYTRILRYVLGDLCLIQSIFHNVRWNSGQYSEFCLLGMHWSWHFVLHPALINPPSKLVFQNANKATLTFLSVLFVSLGICDWFEMSKFLLLLSLLLTFHTNSIYSCWIGFSIIIFQLRSIQD